MFTKWVNHINRVCNQKAMSYIKIKDSTAFFRFIQKVNIRLMTPEC